MKHIAEQFELDFSPNKLKGIMAMSKNRCIGKDGKLPWSNIYKEDFRWFKEFTMGKTLIVGWNTFNTLPRLKGRKGIVLNKMWDGMIEYDIQNSPFDSYSMENPYYADNWGNEKFNPIDYPNAIVAGGKKTYELLMPYISEFYVTHIDREYTGDTFMELFEHLFNKQKVVREFDFGRVIKYSK